MAPNKSKTPFYLIDTQNPFYKPLWLRAAICFSVVIWAIAESIAQQPFWAVIAISAAAYCIYTLFVVYKAPADPVVPAERPEDPDEDEDEADEASEAVAQETPVDERKPD
jgi:hypothetical protein